MSSKSLIVKTNTTETDEVYTRYEGSLNSLEEYIQSETYMSFEKILFYFKTLKRTSPIERNNDQYSLMSSYSLMLLSSTYDIAIKEVFNHSLKSSLTKIDGISSTYISDIINTKILNRYFTNAKHDVVKKTFLVKASNEAELQKSISIINDLISARNNMAHGINPESKTHNDLEEALGAVLLYLNWFKDYLKNEKLMYE